MRNPHPNPLIYLKGVRHAYLELVLKFLYLGECHVANEELQEFLATGTQLRVSGLMENMKPEEFETSDFQPRNTVFEQPELKPRSTIRKPQTQPTTEEHIPNINGNANASLTNIKKYVDKVQDSGRYECTICNKTYGDSNSLWRHNNTVHEGVRFECEQCDHKATTQGNLKVHQESKHEGVRYSCDQCDYKATKQGHLKVHQKSKHEGVRYECDQCNYKATQQGSLKVHH